MHNGNGAGPFAFPGTAASPPSVSTNLHHHSHHHHQNSYGVGVLASPLSAATADWPSPPTSGMSDGTAASPPMGSVLGGAAGSGGGGNPSSARPIRRRPVRKSESDHSYGGFHHYSQHGRSMSNGSSTTAVDPSGYLFMPSPSSPLVPGSTSPPPHSALLPSSTLLASGYVPGSPIVPGIGGPPPGLNGYGAIANGMMAMNGNGHGAGIGAALNGNTTGTNHNNSNTTNGRHKHSRSASSGGSSSSPGVGSLALSPTSPGLGLGASGFVIQQGPRSSRAFSTSSVMTHSGSSSAGSGGKKEIVKEEDGGMDGMGLSEDEDNGQKKRRKRDSRDEKDTNGLVREKESNGECSCFSCHRFHLSFALRRLVVCAWY